MRFPPFRAPLSLIVLLVVLPLSSLAAPEWRISKIALEDEAAPGTAHTFDTFDVAREGAGHAGFTALLKTGGTQEWAAYRSSGASLGPIGVKGDTAPGTGGGTYSVFASFPSVGANGAVSFVAIVSGGTMGDKGLFLDDQGVDSALVVHGDFAPGSGTFTPSIPDLQLHGRNASGETVFLSTVTGGAATAGIFKRSSGGAFSTLELVGDPAPGGGDFTVLGNPHIGDGGLVAFTSDVSSGETSIKGLFSHSGGTTSKTWSPSFG